jgi:hypothetical protein
LKLFIPDFYDKGYFSNMTLMGSDKAEIFLKCVYKSMDTVIEACPVDFKKHIILHHVMIKQDLFKSNEDLLLPYVNSLAEDAVTSYAKHDDRLTTWISGTGQVYSFNKKSVDIFCDFDKIDKFVCYRSKWIVVYCYFDGDFPRVPVSQLTGVRFEFTVEGQGVFSYAVNQSSIPRYFNEINSTRVADPVTNETLLELTSFENFQLISFSRSNTAFMFGSTWELSFYLAARSSAHGTFYREAIEGLLVDGCIKKKTSGQLSRNSKVRNIYQDCLEKCQGLSDNLAANSSIDKTVMQEVTIYNVCYYDCTQLDNLDSTDITESLLNAVNNVMLSDLRFPSGNEPPSSEGSTFLRLDIVSVFFISIATAWGSN